eukprot:376713-Pelagomonas_calceolata.AAC.1
MDFSDVARIGGTQLTFVLEALVLMRGLNDTFFPCDNNNGGLDRQPTQACMGMVLLPGIDKLL